MQTLADAVGNSEGPQKGKKNKKRGKDKDDKEKDDKNTKVRFCSFPHSFTF